MSEFGKTWDYDCNWKMVKIKMLGEVITGNTPSTQKSEYYGGDFLFVSPSDLGKGKYVVDTEKKLSFKGFETTRKLPRGTILVTCIGSIGKMGIASCELSTNQQINAVIFDEQKMIAEYGYYAIDYNFKEYASYISQQTIPIINKSTFSNFEILVPPLLEQQKIADILSSVDEAISKTEAIIEKTEKVKKGLMKELLTKGIRHTKFKKTEIGEIPVEWEIKTIEECCTVLDNKRVPLSSKVREKMQGNVPYYGATGVVDYVNDFIFDDEIVLIGEDGDHFRKYKDWSMTNLVKGKCWVNNHAHVLKANNVLVSNEWIYRFLEHRDLSPYLSIQGATRLKLTQQNLRMIKVAIPKKDEQSKICSTLSKISNRIESEKQKLNQFQTLKKGLMQDLLTGGVRVKLDN